MAFRMSSTHAVQLITACTVIGFALWAWLHISEKRKKKKSLLYNLQKNLVHVVSKQEEWEIISPQFHREVEQMKVIGLDCEWVSEQRISLLQLSTHTGLCVLLRMHLISSYIPRSLRCLLSDKSVLKVGVAVNDDARRLLCDHGLTVSGCVDLRHILRRVRGIYHCRNWGLQGLAKTVLDVNISKDHNIRCGNWEAAVLSSEQVEYAAIDAEVAVDIFRHLVLAKLLGVNPRLNHDATKSVSQDKFWSCARSLCQGIVDLNYTCFSNSTQNLNVKNSLTIDKKWQCKAYTTRKRPLWDNCKLLAPDGQLLCTCDNRKAIWYMEKGLGEKVCDNPLTVKLNFEPSNRPGSDRNYYLQEKENMCVVCGATQSYIRKFVVPQEYRKYFPAMFKEHTSHDVLLMCPPCHRRSSEFDTLLKLQLVQECNAPLESGSNSHVSQDRDLQEVRSAARALNKSRSQIPKARVQELEQILMTFYGVTSLTSELLETAAMIETTVAKGKFIKHGEKVVRYMMEHGIGLLEFQKRWRQHFLETMEPRFLPPLWSVDHIQESWDLSVGAVTNELGYADHKRLREVSGDSGTCRSRERQDTDDDGSDDDGELIE